jgi:serine/threonine protein kinase
VTGPQYILHERLGAGGMGVVYRATMITPVGRREVAIKKLAEQGDLDTPGRARLITEAQLVFRLTHTNICQVIDLGEGETGTCVVMEYVRGCDLRRLMKQLDERMRRLDVATGVYIAREMARALDYAHRRTDERGVVLSLWHGDVTPQNMLLSVEGEVKLTDFGIARALGVAAPGVGLRAGTPGYVAPEVEHGAGDHRADIYGLGMSLVVALTACPPELIRAERDSLRNLRHELSADLCAILARALDDDPAKRFVSALDFERALSLELSRRDPGFTPSVLAELVRGSALAPTPAVKLEKGTTIVSLVPKRKERRTTLDRPRRAHTLTAGSRIWSRRWLVVPAALVVAAATAGALSMLHRVSARRQADVSWAEVEPVATADPPKTTPTATNERTSNDRTQTSLAAAKSLPQTAPPSAPPAKMRAASQHGRGRSSSAKVQELGYLTVTAEPWASVFIDGHRIANETPLYRSPVSPGEHVVRVRFQNAGPTSPPRKVRVAPGQLMALGFKR